jgi:lipopolysaccharide heptosyltransferase II
VHGSPERILIINPFGIGDVLFTTPVIRAVRRAFPASRLAYLCNRRTEAILRHNPHLNELFVYEKDEVVQLWRASPRECARYLGDFFRRLAGERFDLAVDLSLGERYGVLMRLLGVRRRIGFNFRRRGRFLSDALWIDGYHDAHVVEYYRRLLAFMGMRLLDDGLELRTSEADDRWAAQWLRQRQLDRGRPLIGMVPAGGVSWGIGAPFRRWSAEGFAAVGDRLAERYAAQILLFGEPADAPICKTVAARMRGSAIDVSGQTTLGQFVALLSRLQLVLCNDGGPLHLAVSQRVPTVSIFGPVDPRVYGPYGPPSRHRVVCRPELLCRPCYHQFKLPPCPYERACLTAIEPEEVAEACAEALGRPAEAAAAHE